MSVTTSYREATRIPWEELKQRRTIHSPLRYPGGKRRLVPYVAAALTANEVKPDLFVEPFAGGASVALELAASGAVEQIGIADLDPFVASFWKTVFYDCDWLCEQVETVEVNLETWQRMKDEPHSTERSQALACLFLNRTSFNGALHPRAGPIGGKSGQSTYALDCRFPRDRLVRRLRGCERLAIEGRVAFVRCASALDTIRHARELVGADAEKTLFFYLDPPFWSKSDMLYRHSFSAAAHRELAESLRWVHEHYLLSYDAAPEVRDLYHHHQVQTETVELLYATQRSAGFEIVITNLERLPADTRLWRTNGEWRALRRARTDER